MAKFQSPLLGFNNNVRHKSRVFHIQTEDSGVNHPHIITHLFMDGGRILKSVKKSYAEHVGTEGMKEIVRGLMKEQHKAIFIALRDGQFDALVDGGTAPKAAPLTSPAVAAVAPSTSPAAAAATAPGAEAAAHPTWTDPPRTTPYPVVAHSSGELSPATVIEPPRLVSILPPPAAVPIKGPHIEALRAPSGGLEGGPMTTRQAPEVRREPLTASNSAHDLTLDFDALEEAAQDALVTPSLFHSTDLPPPMNLLAKEAGTGAYRTVEANAAESYRREEPPSASVSKAPPARGTKPRAPTSRPPGEARYAPSRPAAIFGSTERPPPASLFSDELVSDKSLDEVILSYLAEDLEPPRRK